ncbi:symmetrical bis(5'-nucleosyl)-tetraphosphatase [Thioalkalivibrio sulfidiphilus]|uniref:Bis(5'-nucleosyl)-tetraphosphatase, symmetrical n=1 Tax=Thioalkalivibrio sulfidiphilus (strain HL-EbGR7) TaxID=396588 RepID=APAH_THISH|nr:symmetrical bis(5'-nucleosyl)-tetraphosphatase [Thioalkalivibrio sulfidiphilus]B8GMY8.1 RecName: Full=Bis(5'-nucleosyl)-tetraphosphatase, symmetrical; AltName: Full=Ap4A hydrolase; AltName: Full=Diadenosine 5',5'''-P1,P4-tetraphosphate pyrophosphohydrolase; AltName: Full=Diadenosine tetraphosphatase [Thioalkalivibrio sulfidiphilus HL-EbGr7]ACL73803.1 bis(5'-nucleosyl)-tetraphosphatase (symmetrical) [Thioalkalivibrio sulfidiphilus HL-EbGr7]
MSIYAVGDLQGCLTPLKRLLEQVRFDPAADQLWLVGDLVNRGPESLEALRFVRDLGDAAITVLGNHDLHLLAIHQGVHKVRRKDTVQPILDAPDRAELMDWLRHRPLLHHDPRIQWTLLHAGLPPQWDLAMARACASEVETVLRGPDHPTLLERMYGDEPDQWSESLQGWARLRFITNCFTRLRYCTADGSVDMAYKGAPGGQLPHLMPWFAVPGRRSVGTRIVFGHWSTLGLYQGDDVLCLDTGCVWGQRMTLARLDSSALETMHTRCE